MNFITKIKSIIGIQIPSIELVLDSNQIKRGESIKGKIKLTGNSKKTEINKISAEFFEIITERVYNSQAKYYEKRNIKNLLGKIEINKDRYALKGGESIYDSFEIKVSKGVWPTSYPTAHIISISADVPGLKPNKEQDIFIL